ncbi:MAG TPA: S8 family serine peptidase, partial [Tepidisphaeraceae bacterium]|nr:S8 family serine peptidase [Tepidisphaeraceae bacterium]
MKTPNLSIESLESRRLLAVSNAAQELISLDDLQSTYASITGVGQTIAVIDTGVDYTRSELGGGLGANYKVIGGYDFVDNDSDPMDEDGHGTGTASMIAAEEFTYNGETYSGIAPDAKLVSLRVGSSDSISDTRVKSALNWVIEHADDYDISVVNMSLGSGSDSSEVTNGTYSTHLATLAEMGILVIVASGNSGDSAFGSSGVAYPASDANAFAV